MFGPSLPPTHVVWARGLVLICLAAPGLRAASAQPVHTVAPAALAAVAVSPDGGDGSEAPIDWTLVAGSGSYIAGAAGGVYLSYLLVPKDDEGGDRIALRIASGVAGGTLASATAVYIADGFKGNVPVLIGGALAGQAAGLGVAAGFVLLDAVFGGREPGFSWLGMAVVLGTPFYATLGAQYVNGTLP